VVETRFSVERLEKFCFGVFHNAGVPSEYARAVASSLIEADLRGVDSHGVVRILIYMERLRKNMINPLAEPKIVSESGSTVLIDGQNNFGAVVGLKALEVAMDRAKQNGSSLVGVRGSNHFGTCAFYALKAIQQELVLIVMSNASQTMPPTGGIRPFIGTNPFAVGIPAGSEVPFILDMATSVVARGKLIVAAQKDESIPLGWAVDKNGNPTTNAEEGLEGSVLPVGGAKGYGISMFIDILSGVLTNAGFGKYVNNMYENWDAPQNVGHFFIAIDINRFMPIELFKERMDQYIREIKAEPKAVGVKEILIPGEIEHRLSEERKKSGIQLSINVVKELEQIGKSYGIEL
jgi:LDH2 family malate/lactate/ureidoglycolate dehydrogenase